MTDVTTDPNPFEHWLAERREICPPSDLSAQVMDQIVELEGRRHQIWSLLLIQRIERSRTARWAVCGGALAIGGLPYLFLAHVAKFLTF